LIVDDNATNRRILEEILKNWGMRSVGAAGAEEALQALRQASRDRDPFHLVLSDVNMPDIDGFELVHRCRQDSELRDQTFLMLTSATRSGDAKRCEDLGIAAHLVKPVKQSELYDSISEALGLAGSHEAAGKADPRLVQTRPLRILLVEDSLANQRLAIGLLSKWGHQVVLATNGREAVERAASGGPFDLVLMDVQMPEMDGFEATARILEGERAAGRPHVPVVAMTAHAMKGDRERCLEAGMDAYLAKPIRAPELSRMIARFAGVAPGQPTAPAASSQEPGQIGGTSPAIDWSVALVSVGGDRALLADVVSAALDEWPKLLVELGSAIDRHDAVTVRRLLHTFKNAFRTLGAEPARELAERLEAAALPPSSPPALPPAFDETIDELSREMTAFLAATQAGASQRGR
jgi:CheY-like chemotaxis protein